MSRAILVDCGVIVKQIPELSRRPNYRLALPRKVTADMVEKQVSLDNISSPTVHEFKYRFEENEIDVYTIRTDIIPFFRWEGWTLDAKDAIRPDVNGQEIVETVLFKKLKWLSSIFRGREISEGEMNVGIQEIAREIVSEICL